MSRRASVTDVNLFPFLSVLVAVIGILTLVLVISISNKMIGLRAIAGSAAATGGDAKPPVLERAIDEERYLALEERVQRLGAQLAAQRRKCRTLAREAAELESLVQAQNDVAALKWSAEEGGYPGLALARPIEVAALPDPSRTDGRNPIPVEITADGYAAHFRGKIEEFAGFSPRDQALRTFLGEIDRTRQASYLLLLVHPNGVENYYRLRAFLESEFPEKAMVQGQVRRRSRIGLGVEPFDDDWLLIQEKP